MGKSRQTCSSTNVGQEALVNHNSSVAHGKSIPIFTEVFPLDGKRKKEKRNNFRITPPTKEMILITNSSVGRLFWQMYLQVGKITNELIPYSRVDTDSACRMCSQKRIPGNNTSGTLLEEFVMSLTCSASIVHTTLTAGPLYFKEIAVWINIIRM